MSLISVIIPVYNTREFLRKCVESVREQSYEELEIILVDDGSTDGSGELCDELSGLDDRIKVLHKTNGGQGSARNMALDIARGEYIAFVDSDDWIDPNMYEILLSNAKKYNADISCCNNTGGLHRDGTGEIVCFTQPSIMEEHLKDNSGTGHSPCDKLYTSQLFNGIRFSEMRAYEDCATIFRLLAKCSRTVKQDLGLYHYHARDNSTMTQPFSKAKFQAIEAYCGMYQFYEREFPDYAHIAKRKLVGSVQYCVGETLARGMRTELAEDVKSAVSTVCALSRADLPIKQRINVFLMERALPLYGLVYRLFK